MSNDPGASRPDFLSGASDYRWNLRYADELRQQNPGLGRKADHEGGRSAAIHLFCLECQGGSRKAVAECEAYKCFLWPYRPGGRGERPAGSVPAVKEYREMGQKLGRGGFSEGDDTKGDDDDDRA